MRPACHLPNHNMVEPSCLEPCDEPLLRGEAALDPHSYVSSHMSYQVTITMMPLKQGKILAPLAREVCKNLNNVFFCWVVEQVRKDR